MTYSTGDRKSVRAAEKQARLDATARAAVTRNLMSTTEGRAWLWDLIASCGVYSSTFIPGSADSTAFNEGQRAVGLRLLADILLNCPDEYIQAQREANVRSTLTERRRSAEPDGRDSGREPGDAADDGAYYAHGPDLDADDPDGTGQVH